MPHSTASEHHNSCLHKARYGVASRAIEFVSVCDAHDKQNVHFGAPLGADLVDTHTNQGRKAGAPPSLISRGVPRILPTPWPSNSTAMLRRERVSARGSTVTSTVARMGPSMPRMPHVRGRVNMSDLGGH